MMCACVWVCIHSENRSSHVCYHLPCQLLRMVSPWGRYGFMSFWSGQFIPIAINIPGRLNCWNVKSKFRNISTFQTHDLFNLYMCEARDVLWKKKMWKNKQTHRTEWKPGPGRAQGMKGKHWNSFIQAAIFSVLFIHITVHMETYLFEVHRDQITFHFHIGFPLVEPSTERLAVILCTLLGSEIQAVFITRVNIAQLINTARARTELAAILRPDKKITAL